MPRIRNTADLQRATDRLSAADPRLAAILARTGPLPLRLREPGFKSLIAIIVDQQISRAAADAIFGRLEKRLMPFTADAWLAAKDRTLARAGLSRPKLKHARAIAERVVDGRLDFVRLARLTDDRARGYLTSVPGIGRWTADIYLLSCMGRTDPWPAADVALQAAVTHALALPARPNEQEMHALAEGWRPWRGVAARLFWAHYRIMIEEKREAARALKEAA
jgi:DNA-3-methyladenine glycosylase II